MKQIRLWYLYDFANSFASIVLLVYYPLILSERGASDAWIGISASISTGILLLILPYLGAYSDRIGKRIFFIKIGSIIMILSLLIMSFIVKSYQSFNLTILFSLSFFYILFQVCFQGSFTFYSAMLRGITDTSNNIKVSGFGNGFGQLGNAIAIFVIGAVIATQITIIGLNGKSLAFFLGAIFFSIISIPFFRQNDIKKKDTKIGFSYKEFFRKVIRNKRIFLFLIGYSLLADAILTFQLYLALYVRKVFSFSDSMVMYVAITGLIFSVIGSFIASKFVYKIKDKNKALRFSSVTYGVCFGLCAFIPLITSFVFLVIALSGISYGLFSSLSRAVYSEITPMDNQGEFFSVFTVFERAASVVGPLVWLSTFYLLKNFGQSIQYRGSVLLLMGVCFIGIYYLKKSENFS